MSNNNKKILNNNIKSSIVLATKEEIDSNRKKIQHQIKHGNIERKELISKLTFILKSNNVGHNKELIDSVSNYLFFKKFEIDEINKIIQKILDSTLNKNEIKRLIFELSEKDKSEITKLEKIRALIPNDAESIKKIVEAIKKMDNKDYSGKFIDIKINKTLNKGKQPDDSSIIKSIEQYCDLYLDIRSMKKYAKIKNEKGIEQLREIGISEIINYCTIAFGPNKIRRKNSEMALKFISNNIPKDYSLLEFTNGTLKLDKNNYTFMKDEFITDRVPKIVFPFEWKPTFEKNEDDKIKNIIKEILKCEKHGFKENIDNFYKCVGNACMPINHPQIFTIFLGPPGTGKSTLLTMLKRIFTYSEISIKTIIKNERFELYPAIDKDINIDDDLQADTWKNIGKLNTFVSGNGIQVELKGENQRLNLDMYNTPKLFGNANILPFVKGTGHERRLILIKAMNKIDNQKKDDSLQKNIANGFYDKGLAKLIYDSINIYYKNRKNLFSEETKGAMEYEWNMRSNPIKQVIEAIFDNSFSHEDIEHPENIYLAKKEAHMIVLDTLNYLFEQGTISPKHRTPNDKKITKEIEDLGFSKFTKNITKKDGTKTTIPAYKYMLKK